MKMSVTNKEISVGNIYIQSVSESSVFLVGDTKVITCSSVSDTPPESEPTAPPSRKTRGRKL